MKRNDDPTIVIMDSDRFMDLAKELPDNSGLLRHLKKFNPHLRPLYGNLKELSMATARRRRSQAKTYEARLGERVRCQALASTSPIGGYGGSYIHFEATVKGACKGKGVGESDAWRVVVEDDRGYRLKILPHVLMNLEAMSPALWDAKKEDPDLSQLFFSDEGYRGKMARRMHTTAVSEESQP